MLERLLTLAIIAGAAYWYWSGPYQDKVNPSYSETLQQNNEAIAECMKRKKYAASRTTTHVGDVEAKCASELNLYSEEGQWYSYDKTRQD